MADAYGWKGFRTGIILDCIDATEYAALVDAAKDGLRLIISAGEIDFVEGSQQWNNLHAIFPDGTATWTAIKEAVTCSKPKP